MARSDRPTAFVVDCNAFEDVASASNLNLARAVPGPFQLLNSPGIPPGEYDNLVSNGLRRSKVWARPQPR